MWGTSEKRRRKGLKHFLCVSIMLVVVLTILQTPITVGAKAQNSGLCGEDVYWTYDSSTKTLTISGNGEMHAGTYPAPFSVYDFENVVIEPGITIIDGAAFQECKSIKNVEIPDSVSIIFHETFWGCSNLQSINVDKNNNIFTSEDGVLYSKNKDELLICPGAKAGSFFIPSNIKYIGNAAFCGCDKLTSIDVDSDNEFYASEDGVLFDKNKEVLIKFPCGKKGDYVVPSSVKKIEEWAFANSKELYSVVIPDSVTELGGAAFKNCSGLTSVVVSQNITEIESSVFLDCVNLKNVTIPTSVTTIGDDAFRNCSSLTQITIPNNVNEIGWYAFAECAGLTSVVIPEGVSIINPCAFSTCTNMKNILVDEKNMSYISEDGVLYDKDKKVLVAYPAGKNGEFSVDNGIVKINDGAFDGCDKLTKVTIPKSVSEIGDTFFQCYKLNDIEVDEDNNYYLAVNGVLFSKNMEKLIDYPAGKKGNYIIPDSVKEISPIAFASCSYLTGVTLSNSLENIMDSAFYSCPSLASITIPDSVNYIAPFALGYECNATLDNPFVIYGSEDEVDSNVKYTGDNAAIKYVQEWGNPTIVYRKKEPEKTPDPIPEPAPMPTTADVYLHTATKDIIIAGLVTDIKDKTKYEYSWYALKDGESNWRCISDWKNGDEWLNWTPDSWGDYTIEGRVRAKGAEDSPVNAQANVSFHPHIKGKCQMPYSGEQGVGYLIGVESYENPDQKYQYEMLILDCTLLAQGLPAWTYTTGQFRVPEGNAGWCIWTPQYGYYWTLFRVYDENGVLIDEQCYGFANIC